MRLTIRSSRDRFAASLMRYRVAHRSAGARPGLTQVLCVVRRGELILWLELNQRSI